MNTALDQNQTEFSILILKIKIGYQNHQTFLQQRNVQTPCTLMKTDAQCPVVESQAHVHVAILSP